MSERVRRAGWEGAAAAEHRPQSCASVTGRQGHGLPSRVRTEVGACLGVERAVPGTEGKGLGDGWAHVEGAWLVLKCKEKSPEALEQGSAVI